jgi:hypothetical protein
MIGALVNCLAQRPERPPNGDSSSAKARSGAEICEIENQIGDRITFVLESGGDGESFASLEKPENDSAPCRGAVRLNQSEAAPGVSGRERLSTVWSCSN